MIPVCRKVSANNMNHLYMLVLDHLSSIEPGAAPRGMKVREALAFSVHLEDAQRALLTWRQRKINYHFAVAEWWWIASGREDVASIAPYCGTIANYSDDGVTFFGAYGPRWTAQSEYVVNKLTEDRDSRQAVIVIFRPSPPATKDVPCTVATQYLIRDGLLHAVVTMRSWDAWLGMPYDMFNFASLQAMIAAQLGVPVGSLTVTAGSLHLYDRNTEAAFALLNTSFYEVTCPPIPKVPGLMSQEVRHLNMRHVNLDQYNILMREASRPWMAHLAVLDHRHREGADDQTKYLDPFWEYILMGRESK